LDAQGRALIQAALREHDEVLLSYSLPWEQQPLVNLFPQYSGQPRLYWSCPQEGLKLAGFGAAARVDAAGLDRFEQVRAAAQGIFARVIEVPQTRPAFVRPRLLGGFAFYPTPEGALDPTWQGFAPACFILPRLLVTQTLERTWASLFFPIGKGVPLPQVEKQLQAFRRELAELLPAALPQDNLPAAGGPALLEVRNLPEKADWIEAVQATLGQIRAGSLQKAVLSRALALKIPSQLSTAMLMEHLSWRYPECYHFWIEPSPGCAFVGATPELLAEVRQGNFRTTSLAGSIRRGSTWVEDAALGWGLLRSAKDRYEHQLVVDDMRSRLEGLVDPLYCPDKPRLRKLTNIQHLETPLHGQLTKGSDLLALAGKLHPTPAMGGVPREAARRHIRSVEPLARGWYAAPVGWLAPGGEGTLAVGIRSALVQGEVITAFAGAGIVAASDPEKEWVETEMKLRPLLRAVEAAV
jgi:isochorismate synthase